MTMLLYRLLPGSLFFYVMIGTVLVGVLMGLFGWIVSRIRKRKARPLEKRLKDNSAATPQAVTDAARRARLDDLRRNFEAGIEKFKAAGKNIYSLPWYVLVGEPGSGKTEAIRHCNVGFPPGLQDQLQGAGGTINMNWWFTNHAVILDTAGRLMFEEIQPGATSEWREFLKMLRASRPNCPINGMLLCIPADSLIKDTADQLERKGAKIAQQLDQIQRALGVRFPVFVMVTKCDLINGFREFFEDITDPTLQHQILGWSNPAPLDEPFNPELVSEHLQTVAARLQRRRMGLLLDPVNTEDPSARRTDQVDALYAFPHALMTIAPRLRRYLEMIFVAGEWSAKPLFLRGIYFTSSMREGSALDLDLAEALGVPVESLPEGKVWQRDRAYFLRDLFMNKVFREKGLVTNASNARGQQRRRKAVVLAAGFLALAALCAFTWWGYAQFRRSIGTEADYWSVATMEEFWPDRHVGFPVIYPRNVGSNTYEYVGKSRLLDYASSEDKDKVRQVNLADVTFAQFHRATAELVKKDIHVPWIFRLAAAFGEGINEKRRRAHGVLFEAGVLRPLVEAARRKIASADPNHWSPRATAALEQLIRLEAQAVYPTGNERIDPNVLFDYVLAGNDKDFQWYASHDAKQLREVFRWTYDPAGSGQPWPPEALGPLASGSTGAVDAGIDAFVKFWRAGGGIKAGRILNAIAALKDSLEKFGRDEADLLAVDDRYAAQPVQPDNSELLKRISDEWRRRYDVVAGDANGVAGAVRAASLGKASLVETFDETIRRRLERAAGPHKLLMAAAQPKRKATPAAPASPRPGKGASEHLRSVAAALRKSLDSLESAYKKSKLRDELLALDPNYMQLVEVKEDALRKRLKRQSLRLFELRMGIYRLATEALARPMPTAQLAGLTSAVERVQDEVRREAGWIDDLAALRVEGYRVAAAAGVGKFVLDRLAKRGRIYAMLKGVLDGAPRTADDVAAEVTRAVKTKNLPPVPRPRIPGTQYEKAGNFPDKYHPKAAAATFAGWQTIANYVAAPSPPGTTAAGTNLDVINRKELADLYRQRQDAYDAYLANYQDYWLRQTIADLAYSSDSWKAFQQDLIGMQVRTVTADLELLGKTIVSVLREMAGVVPPTMRAQWDATIAKLSESMAKFGTASYMGFWQAWLRRWKDLGQDTQAARKTILAKTPTQFVDDYVPFSPGADTDISEGYWKQLAYTGLKLLSDEAGNRVRQAYAALRKTARFPLAVPKAGAKELTPADLAAARKQVAVIFGEGVYDAKAIGGAGRPRTGRFPLLDKYLDKLCGFGLADHERQWCDKARAVLAALPPAGQVYQCTVSILPTDLQDQLSQPVPTVYKTWAVLEIDQGGTKKGICNTPQVKVRKVGSVDLPGGPIEMKLYTVPNDVQLKKVDRTLRLEGAWGPLRLIHTRGARPADTGGKRWYVPLSFEDAEGRTRLLWLALELPKAVPRPDAWPRPSAGPEKNVERRP
ncbi:MAG: hypothetical protein J7M21_04440 [Planctomycetes bacterium]|nr:hypothetical protein [Planctomycetota bacterium]